ncbi:hypothetical protein MKW92_015802 [Papaver armeniacum]|nr:hypothetical protein MKW92_015802 [Papaver armeniacum]
MAVKDLPRPAALVPKGKTIPPYQKRDCLIPLKSEEGGQERLVRSKILPLTVDAHGNVAYDAILRQNENASKIVYASYTDLVPKVLKVGEITTQSTKDALEKIVNDKLSAAQPKNAVASPSATKLIKYRPSQQQSAAFNSGAKERIVTLTGMPVDPLEPPKSKHKKVPKASGSPPVTVMHSPPRPPTVQDYQDRKIPPCVSNWKNPKGYTIPLDKRLAADGRGLQKVQINDNHANLAEVLYVAEGKSRESVALRSKVHKETLLKEKEKKERELRALAQKARSERKICGAPPPSSVSLPTSDMIMSDQKNYRELPRESREEREERLKREKIREERKRERKRERRLEAKDEAMGKKSKVTRDRDRDVSEKVALGMANTGAPACGGDIMYDQRLFDQDKGMDSGFATDDQYNLYDKKLFTAQNTISTLYKPRKDTDSEMYGGADEQLEKVLKTDRFKPHKGFTGAPERAGPRDKPVKFDKLPSGKDDDPFGLDIGFLKRYREELQLAHAKANVIPPYQNRHGFVPRKPEDFGDGGAFPEIPVAQYPLGMGRKDEQAKLGSKILPLTVDAQGNVAFDAIVRQNENASKIVYSSHRDLVPKVLKAGGHEPEQSEEELQKEIEETTQCTKAALEKIVNDKLSAAQPKNAVIASQSFDTQLIQLVKLANIQRDPLEPAKFRHKKVPKGSGSPPVPVMHSPPRQLTNPKGYTIPLDIRLAADGRGLQEVQINDNFAKLAEALYVAEEKARESIAMRSKVQKEMLLKEQLRKEQELRALPQKARSERKISGAPPPSSVSLPTPDMIMCDGGKEDIRGDYGSANETVREKKRFARRERGKERERERERERRLEAKDTAMGKKSKITRNKDRDVSEKVALGMANTGEATRGGEIMYDQRLFNQDKGMDSGFATDDQYNLYDKKLFTAQNTISTLYKPRKDTDSEMYGGFTGAPERAGPRDKPVEFDKLPSGKDDDPFGLDRIFEEVQGGGTMRASGGGSSRDDYNGGSGRRRTHIGFEKGGR